LQIATLNMGLGTFRLLLALGVVVSHTPGYQFSSYPDAGIIAVVTFFFLSGYLMPATYEANYRDQSFIQQAKRFLVNRLLRIYPVYWLALGLAFFAIQLTSRQADYVFSAKSFAQNFLLLGMNQEETLWKMDSSKYVGPAWTLNVELQFYLIVPLLMLIRKYQQLLFLAMLGGVSILGLYYLIHPTGFKYIDQSLLPYFVFFALGMATYQYRNQINRLPNQWLYAASAGIALISLAVFRQPAILQWGLAVASIVFVLTTIKRAPSELDKNLGDLSYPVFILHAPLLLFTLGSSLNFFPHMVVNICLAMIVAQCVHMVVSPKIELIRNQYRRRAA
jgi:peptidoglycan/LPS O-acetylase OafA/YrhL